MVINPKKLNMKKKKLNLKLQLNKETIANLNSEQMLKIKGGASETCTSCDTCYTVCSPYTACNQNTCNCATKEGPTCFPYTICADTCMCK